MNNRQPNRLKHYDYSKNGAYFITICTKDKQKIFWQNSFHDHIIRNQRDYDRIYKYIEENPLKWREDCYYTE